MSGPALSVIIPTLNEAPNVAPLAKRLHAAMAGRAYEMIFVDDASTDGTPEAVRALAGRYPVRLIERPEPVDGLGGAVLEGLRSAVGAVLVVMDADLQHPPELVPELLAPIEAGRAEMVIGSRHVAGAQVAEKWGPLRRINSRVATWLARPFCRVAITDPMSGFFALRADLLAQARDLAPRGYKIGLELLCKTGAKRVEEIPLRFELRAAGESKLNWSERFRYLEHLSRLYDYAYPRLSPVSKFLVVVGLGWAVGLPLVMLTGSVLAGYVPIIAVTALFHARYVRAQRRFIPVRAPWAGFWMISMGEVVAAGAAAAYLWRRLAEPTTLEVAAVAFTLAVMVRYLLRKELMHDLRGLRREVRREEIA